MLLIGNVHIGFNQSLTAKLISKMHLLNIGFGGFFALHLVSLIGRLMNSSIVGVFDGLLSRLTSRIDLIVEFSKEPALADLPRTDFIATELAIGGIVSMNSQNLIVLGESPANSNPSKCLRKSPDSRNCIEPDRR
jgi:hypothetical protein